MLNILVALLAGFLIGYLTYRRRLKVLALGDLRHADELNRLKVHLGIEPNEPIRPLPLRPQTRVKAPELPGKLPRLLTEDNQ